MLWSGNNINLDRSLGVNMFGVNTANDSIYLLSFILNMMLLLCILYFSQEYFGAHRSIDPREHIARRIDGCQG